MLYQRPEIRNFKGCGTPNRCAATVRLQLVGEPGCYFSHCYSSTLSLPRWRVGCQTAFASSQSAGPPAIQDLAPHYLHRTCPRSCHLACGELEQIQFLLGHASVQTTERYLGCKQNPRHAVSDSLGLEDARPSPSYNGLPARDGCRAADHL